ncbi:hypothetical protein BC829DRAFT_442125 [Chytridium lagenaria]|nr:hypothetical protein BC829DRAFT_442125 [Chytridium lagenaria]
MELQQSTDSTTHQVLLVIVSIVGSGVISVIVFPYIAPLLRHSKSRRKALHTFTSTYSKQAVRDLFNDCKSPKDKESNVAAFAVEGSRGGVRMVREQWKKRVAGLFGVKDVDPKSHHDSPTSSCSQSHRSDISTLSSTQPLASGSGDVAVAATTLKTLALVEEESLEGLIQLHRKHHHHHQQPIQKEKSRPSKRKGITTTTTPRSQQPKEHMVDNLTDQEAHDSLDEKFDGPLLVKSRTPRSSRFPRHLPISTTTRRQSITSLLDSPTFTMEDTHPSPSTSSSSTTITAVPQSMDEFNELDRKIKALEAALSEAGIREACTRRALEACEREKKDVEESNRALAEYAQTSTVALDQARREVERMKKEKHDMEESYEDEIEGLQKRLEDAEHEVVRLLGEVEEGRSSEAMEAYPCIEEDVRNFITPSLTRRSTSESCLTRLSQDVDAAHELHRRALYASIQSRVLRQTQYRVERLERDRDGVVEQLRVAKERVLEEMEMAVPLVAVPHLEGKAGKEVGSVERGRNRRRSFVVQRRECEEEEGLLHGLAASAAL